MAATTSSSDVKVTLYWLEQSRAQSILWVLEALSVPYQLKTFKRGPDMLAPEELKAIHPLGKSPVISVERPEFPKPLVLAESGAIVEYLVDHFGGEEKGIVPKRYASEEDKAKGIETEEWLRYRFYLHYIEGSLMPQLVTSLIIDGVRNAPVPFFVKPITRIVASRIQSTWLDKQFAVHFPFLEQQLETVPGTTETQKGGICGPKFNAADMLMSFPIIAATGRGVFTKEEYPEIVAYAGRLQKDEGYQNAAKKIEEIEGRFVASL
ncbi:putative glutathione S-transferase [Talaromyces proteolyticus]|uniref:Glutathione S-transferase n=1 Tax=Talaromyces proteolyticus TaxID=1131652 RepID=A0AAD4PXD1_9EURO|nr:putative glutathione S-transferase [Talaromyces proteolyticus]KAH8699207.1 putative glutathione S-transferase [Talaromyces proteolyticus]